MNLYLKNKKVLITGASRGIGFAIAESFLNEGAKTYLVSRGFDDLIKAEKKMKKKFGVKNVFSSNCDCTNLNELNKLRDQIKNKWKTLDIVIANVGNGTSVSEALPNQSSWDQTWKSNFESAMLTARTFLPMLKNSKGSLLFISSIAGLEAFGAPTDYSTAKTAIISLAKNMARKLADNGIRVNVIAPGNVYFKGSTWYNKSIKNKKVIDRLIKSKVPMNRFASPNEIADSAVFLCSNRASFITGTTLVIDGGQTVGVV